MMPGSRAASPNVRAACAAAVLSCLLTSFTPATASEVPGRIAAGDAPWETVTRNLADPFGYAPSDFDLLSFFRSEPPAAPAAVTTLLRRPASVDSLLPALRADLRDTARGGLVRSEPLWRWIDVPVPETSATDRGMDWFARAVRVDMGLAEGVSLLDGDEIGFLARELPPLFRPSVEDTLLDPVARELARLQGNAIADSMFRIAMRWPLDAIAGVAHDLDAMLGELLDTLEAGGSDAVIRFLRDIEKRSDISVVIGTHGNDTHLLDHGIVFDPGGDDRYEFPDSVRPGTWLMVVDVSGNDTYVARDTVGGAAAFLSAQVLADLDGDDRYIGADFSFASALLGYARLFDAAGDDIYEAGSASLGFAFRGLAILQDRAGDDMYSAAYLSQAASSSFGFAALLDEAGDDRYHSRPVFVDDLRYADRYLSLSQGFSTGFAPHHGGGIAVLHDRSGDDVYHADIYGQGAGYWFGWGLLLDDAGDDRFEAYQYAQGAGVHFAVGALVDRAGNDVRRSKGVSQGCGHDAALGLLVDVSGNDSTYSVDMSTGAGSANGIGVFLDGSGEDAYTVGNPRMTLGHADMRRERPSHGFFLDLRGEDVYRIDGGEADPVPFRNGAVWRTYDGEKRGNGFGLDGGGEADAMRNEK